MKPLHCREQTSKSTKEQNFQTGDGEEPGFSSSPQGPASEQGFDETPSGISRSRRPVFAERSL